MSQRVLILNAPVVSCCGQPKAECKCGGDPTENAGLPLPKIDWNDRNGDGGSAEAVERNLDKLQARANDPYNGADLENTLPLPTMNWKAIRESERRQANQVKPQQSQSVHGPDLEDCLPLPVMSWR